MGKVFSYTLKVSRVSPMYLLLLTSTNLHLPAFPLQRNPQTTCAGMRSCTFLLRSPQILGFPFWMVSTAIWLCDAKGGSCAHENTLNIHESEIPHINRNVYGFLFCCLTLKKLFMEKKSSFRTFVLDRKSFSSTLCSDVLWRAKFSFFGHDLPGNARQMRVMLLCVASERTGVLRPWDNARRGQPCSTATAAALCVWLHTQPH